MHFSFDTHIEPTGGTGISIEIYGVEIWQAYTDQNEVPSHSARAKGQRATFHDHTEIALTAVEM